MPRRRPAGPRPAKVYRRRSRAARAAVISAGPPSAGAAPTRSMPERPRVRLAVLAGGAPDELARSLAARNSSGRSGAGGPLIPAPRAVETARDPEHAAELQRLHCRRRGGCLDLAIRKGWPGFTCAGCSAYQHPEPGEELRLELLALAAFGLAIALELELPVHATGGIGAIGRRLRGNAPLRRAATTTTTDPAAPAAPASAKEHDE